MGFAMACFVNKQYEQALSAIDSLLKFDVEAEAAKKIKPNEMNDVVLLQVRCHIKLGEMVKANRLLQKKKKKVLDKFKFYEIEG